MRRLRSLALPTLSGVLYFVSWIGFGVWPLLFQSYTGVALMPVLPLVQVADLGGVLLLSALQGAVNGAIADVVLERRGIRPWPLIGTAAVIGAAFTYGFWRIPRIDARENAAPTQRVGLAQPNVGEIVLHRNPYASVQALWTDSAELHSRG